MAEQLHNLWLAMGLNQEIVWLTLAVGVISGTLAAIYVDLAVWKGIAISLFAIAAAVVALPWMYPLWSAIASRGGIAGLEAGTSDHMTWIGASAVASLASALVAGRINAPMAETIWVVCISSAAMFATHTVVMMA